MAQTNSRRHISLYRNLKVLTTLCILILLNPTFQHVQGKCLKHKATSTQKARFIIQYSRDNEIMSLGFGLSENVSRC